MLREEQQLLQKQRLSPKPASGEKKTRSRDRNPDRHSKRGHSQGRDQKVTTEPGGGGAGAPIKLQALGLSRPAIWRTEQRAQASPPPVPHNPCCGRGQHASGRPAPPPGSVPTQVPIDFPEAKNRENFPLTVRYLLPGGFMPSRTFPGPQSSESHPSNFGL